MGVTKRTTHRNNLPCNGGETVTKTIVETKGSLTELD